MDKTIQTLQKIIDFLQTAHPEISLPDYYDYETALADAKTRIDEIYREELYKRKIRYTLVGTYLDDIKHPSVILEETMGELDILILRGKWYTSKIYTHQLYANPETNSFTSENTGFPITDMMILKNYPSRVDPVWKASEDFSLQAYLNEMADFQEKLQNSHIEDFELD